MCGQPIGSDWRCDIGWVHQEWDGAAAKAPRFGLGARAGADGAFRLRSARSLRSTPILTPHSHPAAMQWRGAACNSASHPAHTPRCSLKRPPSTGQLQHMAAKHQRGATAALSADGGAAADAPLPDVDVQAVAAKHGWDLQQRNDWSSDRLVRWLPVASIRRPLQGARSNDPERVAALAKSVEEIGLLEPIDVLEVEGQYWGFSG